MTIKEALECLKQISRGKTFSLQSEFWFHDHIADRGVTVSFHVSVWGKFKDIVFAKNGDNLAALIQETESYMDAYYNPANAMSADEAAAQVDEAAAPDIDLAEAPEAATAAFTDAG